MTETDTTEPTVLPDLAAINGASRRDDIRRHINEYHTHSLAWYVHRHARRSATKAEMLEAHDRFHSEQYADTNNPDHPQYRLASPNYRPHTHFTVEPVIIEKGTAMTASKTPSKSTAVAKKAASNGTVATVTTDVPLKSSEKSALIRLMKGDFDALRIDVENYAAAQAEAAVKAAEAEYASKDAKVEKVRTDLLALKRKGEDALRDFIAKAGAAGITVEGSSDAFRYWPTSVRVSGRDNAVQQARNEVSRAKQRALNLLERQRIAVEKTILLASLTAEARTLLDSIPTAQALFTEAMQADSAAS